MQFNTTLTRLELGAKRRDSEHFGLGKIAVQPAPPSQVMSLLARTTPEHSEKYKKSI